MSKVFLFLTLSLALLTFSCDKVVEKPVGDSFSKIQLKEITHQTDSTGIISLDVLTENGIKESVNVQFSTPKKGRIEADLLNNRVLYIARPEESGLDTFHYTITRKEAVKMGTIILDVFTPACEPEPSGNVDYSIGVQMLDSILFIPFDSRDRYCKSREIVLTDEHQLFQIVSEKETGFFVKALGDIAREGNFVINYKITIPGYSPINKMVKFSLEFTPNYCDNLFRVRNMPYVITCLPNTNYLVLNRNQFVGFVSCCKNELVMKNDWFVPSPGLQFSYISDSSTVKILKTTLNEVQFGYRFHNIRGLTSTGYSKIRFGY